VDTHNLTFLGASAAILAAAVLVTAVSRYRRQRRDRQALERAVSQRQEEPPSLHPEIDPDLCIGSLSCLQACPEGDILGIVDGAARLIRGSNCIGHGRCALECLVSAIKLVYGTSTRGVDLPEIDEFFESRMPVTCPAGRPVPPCVRPHLPEGEHHAAGTAPPAPAGLAAMNHLPTSSWTERPGPPVEIPRG